METVSILEYLLRPLPNFVSNQLPTGSNTVNDDYPSVEAIQVWQEFNLETVMACFKPILDTRFPADMLPEIEELDLCFHTLQDESSVALVIQHYVQHAVCKALGLAALVLDQKTDNKALPSLAACPIVWA